MDLYFKEVWNKKLISRIIPKTTCKEFKNNVETNQSLVFVDKNGKTLEDDSIITTGSVVKVGNKLQYNLIVIGDTDNDGEITINDLAQIKLVLIGKMKLE